MKKIFFFSIILLFQCVTVKSQMVELGIFGNWMRNNTIPKGKIKSLIEFSYSTKDSIGEIPKDIFPDSLFVNYDTNNHLILWYYHNSILYPLKDSTGAISKGKLLDSLRVKYDIKKHITTLNCYFSYLICHENYVLEYDDVGKIVAEYALVNDHCNIDSCMFAKEVYKYDIKGNLVYRANSIDEYRWSHKFTYDSANNLLKEGVYDSTALFRKTTYKYDDKGRLAIRHDFNHQVEEIIEYFYDDKGNNTGKKVNGVKHRYTYDQSGLKIIDEYVYWTDSNGTENQLERNLYEYDVYGNRIESKHYDKPGIFQYHDKTQYNILGNIIFKASYNEDGSIIYGKKYKYTYDKEGNWIIKEAFTNNKINCITFRKIKYY